MEEEFKPVIAIKDEPLDNYSLLEPFVPEAVLNEVKTEIVPNKQDNENGAIKIKEYILSSSSNVSRSFHRTRCCRTYKYDFWKNFGVATGPKSRQKSARLLRTNPNYRRPFTLGWRRELVYRAKASGNSKKRSADVYYYMPNGSKLRSLREVSEVSLGSDLELEDFTFYKEPIGINDPTLEIIRNAKPISTRVRKRTTGKKAKILKMGNQVGDSKIKLKTHKGRKFEAKNNRKGKMNLKVNFQFPSSSSAKMQADNGKYEFESNKMEELKYKSLLMYHEENEEQKLMNTNKQNVDFDYDTLFYIFKFLDLQDLLHVSAVCSLWRDAASHCIFWRTVRLKNLVIYNFKDMANTLEWRGTIHLDLRNMILPKDDNSWKEFSLEIKKMESLRRIELSNCPATVVEQLALTNPKLEVINSVTTESTSINLKSMIFLTNLKELHLKSITSFSLTSDLTPLTNLNQLTHLSLTSITDLYKQNIDVIANLINLKSLDLGECISFPIRFGREILIKLNKLEKLRLEKGVGVCYVFEILKAVKTMPCLEELELINFDIKTGFDVYLGACTNLKKLFVIPTYTSQSANTNHLILSGVLQLKKTLSYFVWGITFEILLVTKLFFDQCELLGVRHEDEQPEDLEYLPVLKPIPLLTQGMSGLNISSVEEHPLVEIISLRKLKSLIVYNFPTTHFKIMKIPFAQTSGLTIADSLN